MKATNALLAGILVVLVVLVIAVLQPEPCGTEGVHPQTGAVICLDPWLDE